MIGKEFMTQPSASIFREYDIRGVVGKDLTLESVEQVGRVFGTLLREGGGKTIAVGRDVRLSSSDLQDALCRGVTSTGLDLIDVGICPTPLLYFSLFHLPVDGGVMITGSHNPPEFNGLKLCQGRETLYGEGIQDIRRRMEAGLFHVQTPPGQIRNVPIIPDYIQMIKERFSFPHPPKMVIDCGNGAASVVAPQLFKSLGFDPVELYCEPDGRFPNHHPDPTVPENLKDLIRSVREHGADCGIGYDGDADRIGVVDERGEILWGDLLTLLFARDILAQHPADSSKPKPVFISEVKASQRFYDDIEKKGGKAIMWKAGHSLMKAKMKETKALLGGEMSGHLFFADRYYGFDDALYATCRLLEILSREKGRDPKRRLSHLLADLPKTETTPEIRVDCPDAIKFKLVDALSKTIGKKTFIDLPGGSPLRIIDRVTVDGIRLRFETGWALVRASNTQPALVLRYEATTRKELEAMRQGVEALLEEVKSNLK
jgi:phosphomannomutase/phosphoglucomutase